MTASQLDRFSGPERKEIVKAATRLYKSGAMPSVPVEVPEHLPRYKQRQMARALGWRGSKAKRHNIGARLEQLRRALVIDDALQAAKERVEHPIRSRIPR